MRIYKLKDDYVEYLRKIDPRVYQNKNASRPYVGAVVIGEKSNYFIPLSSPKEKHKTMKNGKDFIKIRNGELGVMNLNCMIPVKDEDIIKFDINSEKNLKYRELMKNQYFELLKNKDTIFNKAINLYNLCLQPDNKLTPYDKKVKDRCLDFPSLERACEQYISPDQTKERSSEQRSHQKQIAAALEPGLEI